MRLLLFVLAAGLISTSCDKEPAKEAKPAHRDGVIAGTIEVASEIAAAVQPTDAVFLAFRVAAGGPPMAVANLPVGKFPMAFELTEANVMMQGTAFAGQGTLTVRIDHDGDAMSKNAGDLSGTASVSVGDASVVVRVDTVQP